MHGSLVTIFVALVCSLAAAHPGFIHIGDGDDNYHVSAIKVDFVSAMVLCQQNGWKLAIEKTAADTLALDLAVNATKNADTAFWIGGYYGTDGVFDPLWRWVDSGEPMVYNHFFTGYPKSPINGTCLLRGGMKDYQQNWINMECSGLFGFICQKQ